jgi:hypothetical protein
LHYLAAYGVLLALAVYAVGDAWRSERMQWLPLAWVGVVPLLIYLPFNLQRRLVEGVQVPLSLLAALGLAKILSLKSGFPGARSRLVVGVVLAALSFTNVLLMAQYCLGLGGQPAPIYREAAEVAALDWLGGEASPDDVVLASYETGNYLPARAFARTFVGHGPETVRFGEKRALMARFFDASTDDAWRRELLRDYGIDYVFWGRAERVVGDFDPGQASYLTTIYDAEGYAVFQVDE